MHHSLRARHAQSRTVGADDATGNCRARKFNHGFGDGGTWVRCGGPENWLDYWNQQRICGTNRRIIRVALRRHGHCAFVWAGDYSRTLSTHRQTAMDARAFGGLVLIATVTLAENLNGAYLIGNPGGNASDAIILGSRRPSTATMGGILQASPIRLPHRSLTQTMLPKATNSSTSTRRPFQRATGRSSRAFHTYSAPTGTYSLTCPTCP